jgi:hypothetical protein
MRSILNKMDVQTWQMTSPNLSLSSQARREVVASFLPHYHAASPAEKSLLLNTFVKMTGYTRTSALRVLNHPPESMGPIRRPRLPMYGPQVQQALFLAWKAACYICAKRLVPYLPTLIGFLERQGHLRLSEESRSHLLSMSVTTAERLLRTQHKPTVRGLSVTKAGPLLKQQIPIRTFQDWDEGQPGFLEADLVGHHGGNTKGCFLYTLTLTDIATEWTECLPLLYKSPEAVLFALRQARALFPFPILGLDIDNGGEFINEPLVNYCEAQQITFTRGREKLKVDQCFVEQKNGAVVRQFVGHDRLVGEQAYLQLRELYRAVRLYVNCFQPRVLRVSKGCEGENVRRVYDPAKTPWQRLVLGGILPADQQHDLSARGAGP